MRHLLRPVVALAAGVLIATTLTTPAQAAADDRGAAWLRTQLTDGVVHNDQFAFDDLGLTVDFGLALKDLGGQRPALRSVRRAMADRVDSYTTGADFGSSDIYAGSVAKLASFAQLAGADPRSYGGVDLVTRLKKRISTDRPTVGRLQDKTSETDFVNTIGQAFAARALARAGDGRAGKAVRFLLLQQCDAGYFRLNFSRPGKTNQGCDAARREAKAPDTDVTALAVLQLRALSKAERSRATRNAVADAVGWMRRTQKRSGSFGGGVATKASNANSTGLAAWALGDAGACRPAKKAARWVRGLQVSGDVTGTPLEGESGAIAYDRQAMRSAKISGITEQSRDQWRRTTAQAASGLAYVRGC